jgi:hypothetical protein
MNYTNGEWHYFRGYKPDERLFYVGTLGNPSLCIAEVYQKEAEANAHLISAAPDMYEALIAVRQHCIRHAVELPDSLVIQCAKAITKAEGK